LTRYRGSSQSRFSSCSATCIGRHVATLGPGDYFGEIALLRDVPRVATCTAETDVNLFTLEREQFVSAVSGHTMSAAEADAVMIQRLSELETPT
jgi:CRP-like cAMP-binding protein